MITEYFKKFLWMNQRITARTHLFGHDYYWMQDVDGTDYLLPMDEEGNPDLT